MYQTLGKRWVIFIRATDLGYPVNNSNSPYQPLWTLWLMSCNILSQIRISLQEKSGKTFKMAKYGPWRRQSREEPPEALNLPPTRRQRCPSIKYRLVQHHGGMAKGEGTDIQPFKWPSQTKHDTQVPPTTASKKLGRIWRTHSVFHIQSFPSIILV